MTAFCSQQLASGERQAYQQGSLGLPFLGSLPAAPLVIQVRFIMQAMILAFPP